MCSHVTFTRVILIRMHPCRVSIRLKVDMIMWPMDNDQVVVAMVTRSGEVTKGAQASLVPRPSRKVERESGVLSDISCHMVQSL